MTSTSGAVLAGPALTWATAVAAPPRAGAADIATGAILTLGAFLQYPTTTAIFGSASLSGSALLPGARVNLGRRARAARLLADRRFDRVGCALG